MKTQGGNPLINFTVQNNFLTNLSYFCESICCISNPANFF